MTVTVTGHVGAPVRVPGLRAWLGSVAPARARGEVSVAFVSDAGMRVLNRTHRGQNYATDVLSFPAGEAAFLGDIVIATGVARRQALAAGHPFGVEARVLALHGLLHLLGYDHETDGGAMSRLETRLRRKGGLRESLIERRIEAPPRTAEDSSVAPGGSSLLTRGHSEAAPQTDSKAHGRNLPHSSRSRLWKMSRARRT
jgi:probable rRNA maturation factor